MPKRQDPSLGNEFPLHQPFGRPSVSADGDSLVDVDSPDDFGLEESEGEIDAPVHAPGRPKAAGKSRAPNRPAAGPEGKEYWPEPLRGKGAPR